MSIKIHVLHTGLVTVDKSLPAHEAAINPLAYTGIFRSHKNKITIPVSSYLIEHPKGLILIDTGWNELVRTSQKQELGLQININQAYLPASWSVREQIKSLGFKTSDIDYVMLSHLHSDHASGLPLVADAKAFLTSEEEWQTANHDKLRYIPKMWQGINMKTFHFEDTGHGPFGRSFDLFNDGSIEFLFTPGHSLGLAATIIRGESGQEVLLASDTGYSAENINKLYTPGIVRNRGNAIQSIGWIREKSRESQVIELLANHDPEVKPHTIVLN